MPVILLWHNKKEEAEEKWLYDIDKTPRINGSLFDSWVRRSNGWMSQIGDADELAWRNTTSSSGVGNGISNGTTATNALIDFTNIKSVTVEFSSCRVRDCGGSAGTAKYNTYFGLSKTVPVAGNSTTPTVAYDKYDHRFTINSGSWSIGSSAVNHSVSGGTVTFNTELIEGEYYIYLHHRSVYCAIYGGAYGSANNLYITSITFNQG